MSTGGRRSVQRMLRHEPASHALQAAAATGAIFRAHDGDEGQARPRTAPDPASHFTFAAGRVPFARATGGRRRFVGSDTAALTTSVGGVLDHGEDYRAALEAASSPQRSPQQPTQARQPHQPMEQQQQQRQSRSPKPPAARRPPPFAVDSSYDTHSAPLPPRDPPGERESAPSKQHLAHTRLPLEGPAPRALQQRADAKSIERQLDKSKAAASKALRNLELRVSQPSG